VLQTETRITPTISIADEQHKTAQSMVFALQRMTEVSCRPQRHYFRDMWNVIRLRSAVPLVTETCKMMDGAMVVTEENCGVRRGSCCSSIQTSDGKIWDLIWTGG